MFLYADDVCLMASNEQDLQIIFDNISGCISEYGMKVVKKSQWWFVLMERRNRADEIVAGLIWER